MWRRSPAVPAFLAVIALVVLPAISNVEANALPSSWTPFLWTAWPAGLVLAAPLVYLDTRQRQRDRQPAQVRDAASTDHRRRVDRAAADLAAAVYQQWTDEARLRSVRYPKPLRVRWSSTRRPVASALGEVVTRDAAPGRPLAIRGDTAQQMARLLASLQDRQLVILGEAGAGKTVLALLLVLRVLEHRKPEEPVPVLLTVSSWNPRAEHLHTWMVRRILEEYPALGNQRIYGVDAVRTLVSEGRVMAVLDGLDEMSAPAQPLAINAIDQTAGRKYPLVLTCRSTEYEAAVTSSGAFLSRAAVVEVQPVDLADAGRFLTAATPGADSRWKPVLKELSARPGSPLARVLASPLMVSLARVVYAAPASDPQELLDTTRFTGQGEIERHLLDGFIPASYRDTPAPLGASPADSSRYPPQQARAYLAFLAGHLDHLDTGDLAWWHLADMMPRTARALCIGVPVGLLFGAAGELIANTVGALSYALAFGAATTLAVAFGRPPKLTRVQLRFRGTAKPFLRRFAAASAVGLLLSLAVRQPTVPAIGEGLIFGLAFAPRVWLDIPTDATEASTPRIAIKQDRTAAFAFGLTLAVPFGLANGVNIAMGSGLSPNGLPLLIGTIGSTLAGGFAGYIAYGWPGAAAYGFASSTMPTLAAFGSVYEVAKNDVIALEYGLAFGLAAGAAGVLSRAWGSFTVGRIWLALHGRQPWRLMGFLDDAHRRGVLRQSGGMYEFRHLRLRDHLAHDATTSRRSAGKSVTADSAD